MAHAILAGALAAGVVRPESVAVAEPDAARHAALTALGLRIVPSAAPLHDWLLATEPAPGVGRILLAVKPQMLPDVAAELRPALDAARLRRVAVSILAGVTSAAVERALGDHAAAIRVMPATPARIAQSATAWCPGPRAAAGDESTTIDLFRAVGPLVERIDEPLMDAFTALAGSGPAYLFYLAEAMARAGVAIGFDPAQADRITRQTLAGAALLLRHESHASPDSLRAAVTSKGGTTAAATTVLDHARTQDTIVQAITAARDRARELGR